jgi:hypothetical protein
LHYKNRGAHRRPAKQVVHYPLITTLGIRSERVRETPPDLTFLSSFQLDVRPIDIKLAKLENLPLRTGRYVHRVRAVWQSTRRCDEDRVKLSGESCRPFGDGTCIPNTDKLILHETSLAIQTTSSRNLSTTLHLQHQGNLHYDC